MEEEKKKGVVEKSGEELGKVANKGVGVVKGFGKGLVKGNNCRRQTLSNIVVYC